MSGDDAAKAWVRIARSLATELPGDWVTARTGISTILVRTPIDWVLEWAGVDRIRRDDPPYLIGGQASLLGRFRLSVGHGIRSDQVPGFPRRVDLVEPDGPDRVRQFLTDELLPRLDDWTPQRLAAEAEDQLATAEAERGRPIVFPNAAGWRVVNNTGSPVDPATQAVGWFTEAMSPDDSEWHRSLLEAWETDGRPGALAYLERQRESTLSGLKLT